MDWTELGLKAVEVLAPVALGALTLLAGKLAQLIHARVKLDYLRGVLLRLDDAVIPSSG